MEARRLYSEAVARHPDDPISRVNLANLLIQGGEAEKAREHCEHALKIDPNCRLAHALAIRAAIVNHPICRTEGDALAGRTLSRGGALPNGDTLGEAVERSREFHAYTVVKSQLQAVEQQLASQPGSVALLFLRGNILEQMGQSLEASKSYIELLDLDPSHVGALNHLGNLLFAAGKNMEARRLYSEAVARHPDDPMSRVNFATLLFQEGEPEQAREHCQHALTIDPN